MEICEVKKEGLKRVYTIKIAADAIASKNSERLNELQKNAKISGFRAGKVPAAYLSQRFGQAITQETMDDLVKKSTMDLLKKEDLNLASQPEINIKEYNEGEDLNYEVNCELLPDVKELDYPKIKLTNYVVKVPQSEVDKQIEADLSNSKEYKPVKDKKTVVKKGHGVTIDYEGSIDGEKFAGGSSKDYKLEIGSKTFIDNFEEQLIGTKIGDHKTVKVKFPKEYHNAEYQGKAAQFEVDIKDISDIVTPELTDEFAKEKTGAKDVADYKNQIKTSIEGYYNKQARDQFKKELFDYMDSKISLDLPDSMVDSEFKNLLQSYLNDNGYKTEEEAEQKDAKKLKQTKKEYLSIAKRRVKVGIILSDLAKKNNIDVTDDELIKALQEQIASSPYQAGLFEYYQKNPKMVEYFRGPLLEEKVVDLIHGKITLKDKELTIEQFKKISE